MHRADTPKVIIDLLERSGRLLQRAFHADGAHPAQWQVLRYLARANRFSRTPKAIGLYLEATKGTVSQTILALDRKGLVRKSPSPLDARSVTLQLTPRGQAALAGDPLTDIASALEALPVKTQIALGDGLAGLIELMLVKMGGRPFGQCELCRFFQKNKARGDRDGPHRCGLIGVALSADDSSKICVEHEPVTD